MFFWSRKKTKEEYLKKEKIIEAINADSIKKLEEAAEKIERTNKLLESEKIDIARSFYYSTGGKVRR